MGITSMNMRTGRSVAFCLISVLGIAASGCTGRPASRLLSLIGLSQKPLVISIVADRPEGPTTPLELLNPFESYSEFNQALGKAVNRSVAPDLVFPFQVGPNLSLGICHLAIVSPLQFGQMSDADKYPVVAVFADEQGRTERSAVLVVAARSNIQDAAGLKGKIVGFGPAGDARTHQAGLALLASRGINRGDLSLEPLPLPGSLKHFPHMRAVAQSVINGSSDAGFIDELAWEQMPETDDREGEPSRSKLRVIDRAQPTPERLIVASPALEESTRAEIRDFLMSAHDRAAAALRPMKCSGFKAPADDIVAKCRALANMTGAEASSEAQQSQ